MISILCAICRQKTPFNVLYKANFKPADVNPTTYTSRRIPDRTHFRIVRCSICGLVYSNPIYDRKKILDAYKGSANPRTFDLKNSAKIYASYLQKILKNLPSKQRLLDIGCGDGFFLLEAKRLGFKELYGVEPSKDAVLHLPKSIDKRNIVNDIFKKGQFRKDFFDIICFFQVLDHVLDPNKFLRNCLKILKPHGIIFAVMHDARALTHKVLGERSPIFDIQHIYLFDKETVQIIFRNNVFLVEKVFNIPNNYSVGYWLTMSPLSWMRRLAVANPESSFAKINIPLKVGNMAIIAKKRWHAQNIVWSL